MFLTLTYYEWFWVFLAWLALAFLVLQIFNCTEDLHGEDEE